LPENVRSSLKADIFSAVGRSALASPNKEIIGVQYLRGLAALGVVVAHTSVTADFPKYFGREILGGFLAYGGSGVDLFFVISGFIMCATALKGPQLEPALSAAAFAAKRFTRIIPLMWVAVLSYILLRYLGRRIVHPIPYLRAFFLFPAGVESFAQHEPTQRHNPTDTGTSGKFQDGTQTGTGNFQTGTKSDVPVQKSDVPVHVPVQKSEKPPSNGHCATVPVEIPRGDRVCVQCGAPNDLIEVDGVCSTRSAAGSGRSLRTRT
jgi:Acyltransferase family